MCICNIKNAEKCRSVNEEMIHSNQQPVSNGLDWGGACGTDSVNPRVAPVCIFKMHMSNIKGCFLYVIAT